jgi:cyclopropane fatty-acyl-phospholipid synthase-like methyltransferase
VTRLEQHTVDWDERFRREDVPWEDENVAPAVVDLFHAFAPPPATVLEIGCGLGTTALWLARKGYEVAACDISATAISHAETRAKSENLALRLFVADVLVDGRQLPRSDVVFSRGVLHTFANGPGRRAFADAVAQTQEPGRLWLDVSGSADTPDDPRDAQELGFPRLTLAEIADAVERLFEIVSVRQVEYGTTPGLTDFRAFACVFRRRVANRSAGRTSR